jgi:hypothetical protein
MRSFFRNLEREGVEFILISGQAAILYGAATFSEDFDLWVRPTSDNLGRLRAAIARAGARVYKLTPALTLAHARSGHGFHFTVPDERTGTAYVDIMGRPPRVAGFTRSRARCETMRTDWGPIPVVSIEDLVRLKLTRRLGDYDVIANLASVRLRREERPSRRTLSWCLETTFRLEDVLGWLENHPTAEKLVRRSKRPMLAKLARGLGQGGAVAQSARSAAALALAREIVERQAADVAYWRPVIDELRQLRASGSLLEVGSPVLDVGGVE